MILNGIKLLIRPKDAWEKLLADQGSHAPQLFTAALTAATLPAIVAVAGHLASSYIGYAAHATAIQRAAIGFVAIALGALVMIPALSLALVRIGNNARIPMTPNTASASAMAIVWASWISGIVLAIPPLLNIRPEYGELLWFILAVMCAFRVIRKTINSGVAVHRRWRTKFTIESMIAFIILFFAIPVFPPLLMRFLLGVTGQVVYGAPPELEWPHPPPAAW